MQLVKPVHAQPYAVYVHPSCSTDIRLIRDLEKRTNSTVVISQRGQAVLKNKNDFEPEPPFGGFAA
ncbi:hypothetical protein VQ643_09600 [Pseudomonas sp. F1_0610]|uniref:hypothetical protein n=1 Tax=Pseudomonas sp. F1_0610 TaxID=3114284 RepID=UPI0039C246C6